MASCGARRVNSAFELRAFVSPFQERQENRTNSYAVSARPIIAEVGFPPCGGSVQRNLMLIGFPWRRKQMSDMNNNIYIYSIIQEKGPRTFLFPGVEGERVYMLNHMDIAAVVSNCNGAEFDKLDNEELRENLTAHQSVNEKLLASFDVVPMAFGMVARDENEVIAILNKAYLQFEKAFKRIKDKFEFAVQTYWHEDKILNELISDESIKALRAQARAGGKDDKMSAKIRLGKLAAEMLACRKLKFCDEIEKSLRECSESIKRIKLTDENMISNLALLVDKSKEKDLDETMQSLGNLYGDKLRFKYIGPLAPASFVCINLKTGNFDLLENARKILDIPQEASWSEIRDNYLTLARKYHPDRYEYKNDQNILAQMTQKMQEIQDAYETVQSYCKMNADFSTATLFSFRKQDVQKSLLIKES